MEGLVQRVLTFLGQRLDLLRVTEDEMTVPRMPGQRAILLHFIQLGALDQCQRILLSVDDLGLERRVQLAERYRGRRGAERFEHGEPKWDTGHTNLEPLQVVGR